MSMTLIVPRKGQDAICTKYLTERRKEQNVISTLPNIDRSVVTRPRSVCGSLKEHIGAKEGTKTLPTRYQTEKVQNVTLYLTDQRKGTWKTLPELYRTEEDRFCPGLL